MMIILEFSNANVTKDKKSLLRLLRKFNHNNKI